MIPARGGSKGIPRKNIYNLAGKPLIAWTITSALKSKMIDEVVVSTDDEEIADIARCWGAKIPFVRPPTLASDGALRNDVIRHALTQIPGYDVFILLQPTSPLRNENHINEALNLFFKTNSKTCVSIARQHPAPNWIYKLSEANQLIKIYDEAKSTNRQELECFYKLNGAIYISYTDYFLNSNYFDPLITNQTIGYKMKDLDSLDIDNINDIKIVENIIMNKNLK